CAPFCTLCLHSLVGFSLCRPRKLKSCPVSEPSRTHCILPSLMFLHSIRYICGSRLTPSLSADLSALKPSEVVPHFLDAFKPPASRFEVPMEITERLYFRELVERKQQISMILSAWAAGGRIPLFVLPA